MCQFTSLLTEHFDFFLGEIFDEIVNKIYGYKMEHWRCRRRCPGEIRYYCFLPFLQEQYILLVEFQSALNQNVHLRFNIWKIVPYWTHTTVTTQIILSWNFYVVLAQMKAWLYLQPKRPNYFLTLTIQLFNWIWTLFFVNSPRSNFA